MEYVVKMSMEISIVIPMKIEEDSLALWGQVRHENGPLDGMIEFPGGKIEPGESPINAAYREFKEEVGFSLNKITLFTHHAHSYKDRDVLLYVYVTDYVSEMNLIEQKIPFENAKYEVEKLNIPQANKEIIMQLIEHAIRESSFNE